MQVHGTKKKKILICGLPGSGKSTLANKLAPMLGAEWLNADAVRKAAAFLIKQDFLNKKETDVGQ